MDYLDRLSRSTWTISDNLNDHLSPWLLLEPPYSRFDEYSHTIHTISSLSVSHPSLRLSHSLITATHRSVTRRSLILANLQQRGRTWRDMHIKKIRITNYSSVGQILFLLSSIFHTHSQNSYANFMGFLLSTLSLIYFELMTSMSLMVIVWAIFKHGIRSVINAISVRYI